MKIWVVTIQLFQIIYTLIQQIKYNDYMFSKRTDTCLYLKDSEHLLFEFFSWIL